MGCIFNYLLIQTCGRAARNAEGRVIFYADKETDSIRVTVDEVKRRRALQIAYNEEHGIVPTAAGKKASNSILSSTKPSGHSWAW